MNGIIRTILKVVCALSAAVAVMAGSFTLIAPAVAQETRATSTAQDTSQDTSQDSSQGASGERQVSGVTFQWGVSKEAGGGAFAGGCNFLSAGEAGNAGGSAAWTEDQGLYKASDGNVRILKPTADGTLAEATWATKCLNRYGSTLAVSMFGGDPLVQHEDSPADGAPADQPSYSGNVVRITGGSGTVDPSTDTAHIAWKGSFTIVFYGGMTYWSITDPVLDVKDGHGSITGSAIGYAADRDDPSKWTKLDPVAITLADFTMNAVDVADEAIVDADASGEAAKAGMAQPDYLGVAYSGEGQVAKSEANAAYWGAFPESWMKYNETTGQSTYWLTSGSSLDPRKTAEPIVLSWAKDAGGVVAPSAGGGSDSGGDSDDGSDDDGSDDDQTDGDQNNNQNDDQNNNQTGDRNDGNQTDGYTLRWGMNDETNSAAYAGVCNFLSAGVAADTGKSRVWDESLYRATSGNVSIEKPDAQGAWTTASWATRCLTRDGSTVSMGKRADGRAVNTESQVVITHGTGERASDGALTVRWSGSWTVAYYGGMTYWSVTDPTLTLDRNGDGALTATASGYAASRTDASKWTTLASRTITLADIRGVDLAKAETEHGFTTTPLYLGVAVTTSGDGGQAAKDDANAAYWGSFPQSFIDFQTETGQSAYWYTANGARDFAKPTLPLSVGFDADYRVDAPQGSDEVKTANPSVGTSTGTASRGGAARGSTGGAVSDAGGTGDAGSGSVMDSAADDGATVAGSAMETTPLVPIVDNAATIAVGAGSVAVASALPLGVGWAIRRRLGLDPAAVLDGPRRRT